VNSFSSQEVIMRIFSPFSMVMFHASVKNRKRRTLSPYSSSNLMS
jgi:hypothetical protein